MDPYIRALIENDGLEEVLADELEWTASQGEELMDSDDEADLLAASRRADQKEVTRSFALTWNDSALHAVFVTE